MDEKQMFFRFPSLKKFYPPPPIKTPPFEFSKNVVKNNFLSPKQRPLPQHF